MISLRGNAAIHYLPLSESGASDRSPMQAGHRKRMVFATGAEFSAERPTGAGLMLGMGLRDIGGEAGRMIQRRRSLWSAAEPEGLGGVMPHLIGLAGFFTNPEQKKSPTRPWVWKNLPRPPSWTPIGNFEKH